MAEVNFNLKNKNAKNKSLINLIFNFNGQRIKLSTGYKIEPKYWNDRKQRAKELLELPDNGQINLQLEKLSRLMIDLYNGYKSEGWIPKAEILRQEFLNLKANPIQPKVKKEFWDHFEDFVSFKRTELGDVRDYHNSLRKHLQAGEVKFGQSLTFRSIKLQHEGFVDAWDQYLIYEAVNSKGDHGLSVNTVGKQHKNLKVFLNWCFDREIHPRYSLKHLPTLMEEVDKVYLKSDELLRLESLELKNENEIIVRDLFMIGCETGLRFSDFSRLKPQYFERDRLIIRSKKTGSKQEIPISTRVRLILEKYKAELPTFDSRKLTLFNHTIRDLCKRAEIDDSITIYKRSSGKTIEEFRPKYQEISTHSCRRTFCTLKFIVGMPAQAIMMFSGHKTEKSFMKYLKLDAELTATEYADYF
ncbi:MAG: integrase [Parvicellaceae bacterium]|jgi:integrase